MQKDSVNQRLRVAINHFKEGAKSSQIKGLGGDWLATDLTVDYTRGSLELKLSPLFEAGPAEKAAGGKPLELEGLKFRVGQGGILIDGPAGTAPKHYGLTWQAVTALVDWLAVEFDKRKAEPTIADLIEQGYLTPRDSAYQIGLKNRTSGPTPTAMGAWRRGAPYKIEDCPGLQATPWNGEGKPPVGCECENSNGERLKAIGYDEGELTVCRRLSGPYKGQYGCFSDLRPLRTAEQLAAEVREAEIDRLCKVVMAHPAYQDYNLNLGCSAAMRLAVEAIVDADA